VDGIALFRKHKYAGHMRFLARIRLSVSQDESTSVERQRETIAQWAKLHDHTIVGWAEDIDVSGKLSPFDTPKFGDWLNNRHPEFDGVVAWKLDRLARSMFGINDLFQWAQNNDKTVVSITESLDLSTTVGVMIAQTLAGVAQMELEAIQDRQSGSQVYLRSVGRWPGGNPPYGYRVMRNGDGCKLDLDREKASVMTMIVGRILDGNTMASVCRELNDTGVPAPTGGEWRIQTMRLMLRNPALRGQRLHKGQVILNGDGQPVVFGPELVDAETFQRLQAVLKPGLGAGLPRNASPLSGLLKCECGLPLYFEKPGTKRGINYGYRYYRSKCEHRVSGRAEKLEQLAEMSLLGLFGDREITRRQWVPGNDNSTALADAVKRAMALGERLGTTTSRHMTEVLQRQLDSVEAELARLESLPQIEGHWAQVGIGRTWKKEWAGADANQRRAMMREAGLSFQVSQGGKSVTVTVDGSPSIDRTEAARQLASPN
jgi:site-specific DNA recombinase